MAGSIRLIANACMLVCGLLVACAAHAGVYKWRDAQGNLHYSDTPPPDGSVPAAQGGVQEMAMSADFADAKVTNKVPIPNPRPNGGAGIAFDTFTLKLDSANGNNVTIGREFSGKNCSQSIDVQWHDGVLDLKGRVAALAIAERFRKFGYSFVGTGEGEDAGGMADLSLDAELLALKFDVCSTIAAGNVYGPGSRAFVKVRWSLRRAGTTEPLFRGITAGAYDAWRPDGGTKQTVSRALAAAADNLLGERAFIDQVTDSAPRAAASAVLPPSTRLAVAYGDGAGTFRTRSDSLLRSAITVKTARGHGSGVLIDSSGYALTNAHVVGTESQVQVLLDDKVVDAKVVRSDRRADVALLLLDPQGHEAANISRREPHAGDPLYVVGTPLSLKLSHTVTQGILSAVREVDGERRFQTDAAVNPGNSGGPVFNEAGELVALSVSGIMNAEGASLNVNYLIPIGRALTAVGASAD